MNQVPHIDMRLHIRDAEPADCYRLWVLANDPVGRSVSFSQDRIEWKTHVEWFSNAVENPDRRIFVAEDADGDFVGQIRFDRDEAEAVVSVQIDPSKRGRGLGTPLIVAGTHRYLDETPGVHVIHAFIKTSNDISVAVFSKAGYEHSCRTEVAGQEAYEMIFRRDFKG